MEEWPWTAKVYSLGQFELHINGKPVRFTGKVQKKPLDMLKCLIALGGSESREGQIADLLWPEADGDTAKNSLKITLHRLREILGSEKIVRIRGGKLSLDKHQLWSDAWAFEELLSAITTTDSGERVDEFVFPMEKALALYQGHFLDEDGCKPWTSALRKRLRDRFRLATVALGNLWRRRGNTDRAIACYQRGLGLDNLAEELYQNLMECYLSTDLKEEAVTTYRRCKDALIRQGLTPSHKSSALHKQALN